MLKKDYFFGYNNLGNVYLKIDEIDKAIINYDVTSGGIVDEEDSIVEQDALETFEKSTINYLYFPEEKLLCEKL